MALRLPFERWEAMSPEMVPRIPAGTVGLIFSLLVAASALEAIALRKARSL
jgi:hypothetical protein